MAAHRPLRLAPEWDDRFTRMVVVSAVLHVGAIVATVWLLAGRGGPTPPPDPTKRAAPQEPEVHAAEKPKPPEPKPPPKPPEPKPEPPKTATAKPTPAKPTPAKPETHAATKPEAAAKPGAPAGKETH